LKASSISKNSIVSLTIIVGGARPIQILVIIEARATVNNEIITIHQRPKANIVAEIVVIFHREGTISGVVMYWKALKSTFTHCEGLPLRS
jgi:hypothetical protein